MRLAYFIGSVNYIGRDVGALYIMLSFYYCPRYQPPRIHRLCELRSGVLFIRHFQIHLFFGCYRPPTADVPPTAPRGVVGNGGNSKTRA